MVVLLDWHFAPTDLAPVSLRDRARGALLWRLPQMTSDSRALRASSAPGPRSDLLDDATVKALEDLLRLGAAALRVERCVMGLASPRDEAIHSLVGVTPEEAPQHITLCSYAMTQGGLTVVSDLREIIALADLPRIRAEGGYRLLAGGPLVDANGVKRGGLAALGATPRELVREERRALAALSRQIIAQLEQRRRIQELAARGLHQAGTLSMLRGVLKASTTVAVIGMDITGRIKLFSEGAERMFGVTAREVVGRAPTFLLAGGGADAGEPRGTGIAPRPPSLAALIEGVSPDTPVERTWLLRRAGGALFPASLVTAFVMNENADVTGYAMIARDITEQLAVEHMKDDFVSMVSHELRTPLTSIRGALGLLAGEVAGPLTPGVYELVDIAQANSARLLYLVNDILDLQRLASGKLDLSLEDVDLAHAVDRAIQLVRPLSDARGVSVSLQYAAAEATALADRERVVQVLVNLLSNAVKHSPPGSEVLVGIEPAGRRLRVSVEDSGPGVPENQRDRLFQKFARLSSEPGSAGLGLAIVKALVTLHGGSVAFRPASPHGAIFSFDLPRRRDVGLDSEEPPPSVPTLTNPISVRTLSMRRATTPPPPREPGSS